MRFWYVSQKRERIFDHAALLLFLTVLLAVLLWLFPQQGAFREKLPDDKVDAVSIAYLELLSRSAPEDNGLRNNLLTQLAQTGQYERAYELLQTMQATLENSKDTELQLLYLEVLAQLTFWQTQQKQRQAFQAKAIAQMIAVQQLRLSANDRERLAAIALSLSRPVIAADQYLSLAEIRKLERPKWLERAIKWYRAAERHATVAMLNETLAQHHTGTRRVELISEAVRIYRMLKRQDQALAVLERYLNQASYDAGLLINAADIAHEMANKDRVISYLQRVLQERLAYKKDLIRVRELAMSLGEITLARDAAIAINRLDPSDQHNMAQLARLYEWNEQGAFALTAWLQLLDLNPDEENLAHARKLAIALFDHETVIAITEQIGHQRRLNAEELNGLSNAYSQHSRLDSAIDYLQSYVLRYPEDENAWRSLARIAEFAEAYDVAKAAWRVLLEEFSISVDEAQHFAGIHWSFDETAAAFDVLTAVKPAATADDRDYWAMLAQIAWQEGEHELAVSALRKAVKDFKTLSAVQADIFLLLQDPSLHEEQLEIARSAWQRFGKPQYLIQLMILANTLKDDVTLARALAEAQQSITLFEDNPTYWLVKGDYEYRQRDYALADHSYWSAVQLSSHRSDTLAAYLWFLINTSDHEKLAYFVAQWQSKALQEPSLYQAYAVAYSVLGDYDIALHWFQRVINEFGPQYDVLLDYADVLSYAGLEPAAWRLKRYVYQSFRTQPQAFPVNQQYRAMQPVNRALTIRLLKQKQGTTPVDLWLPQYVQQVWSSNRVDEINFWRAYIQRFYNDDLPFHQQVVLALGNQDKYHAQDLLLKGGDMPASQRANLIELADSRSKAQSIRLAALDDAQHAQEQLELRRDIVREVLVHESGVAVSGRVTQQGLLDTEEQQIRIKQSLDNIAVEAKIQRRKYTREEAHDIGAIGEEKSLTFILSGLNESGNWQATASLDQRQDANKLAFSGRWQRQLQAGVNLALSAQWNGRDNTTALSKALVRAHAVQTDLEWHVSSRDRLEFMLGARQYTDWLNDNSFANGMRGRLRYTHHVNYQRPSLYFSVGYDWQSNSIDSDLPDNIQRRLTLANLGQDSLLPKNYGELGMSATVQHGSPHALNADTPSPRYILSVGVAQRLQQSATVFSVQAGVGVPIIGNDELAFSYRFNSKPIGGIDDQDSHVFKLSYNYRFGR